ncbi:thiamine phosphate synthase [Geothrix mesophila]|uniref:thiamine phosphate synthase n=1 Tax=Geothrix mesophila TaxID=2922723 RepID=UPI001FAD133B|nr:thiamine phosphate synthase [Geothrix sp. SG198]
MILLAITPGLGFDRDRWAAVLRSGVDGFLIREKQLEARALLQAATWCQDTAPEVTLWVAGRLDVAFAAGCGLHAPEAHPEVEPGLVPLSRPLHDEGQWATRSRADQLLISPIFASPGKGAPWGPERLRRFLDGLPAEGPRLLALGGVDPAKAALLRHPRLVGAAAIRPFWEGDPRRAVAAFRERS